MMSEHWRCKHAMVWRSGEITKCGCKEPTPEPAPRVGEAELRLVKAAEMISWLTDLNSNWSVCRNTRSFIEGEPSEYWKKFDKAMGEAFELQVALMKLTVPSPTGQATGAEPAGEQLANDILRRIAKRYANCEVRIYHDLPELTPVEAVLRCAKEEGFMLTQIAARAVPSDAPIESDASHVQAFRKEKRFSIEEMEADRGSAARFICEAFGFTDVRSDDSMVRLAQRIKEWKDSGATSAAKRGDAK